MVTKEQIDKANKTTADAFEATKRIYDLAAIACQRMTEDLAEQLSLRRLTGWWNSGDSKFLQRYGQLSEAEKVVLKRYYFTAFAGTKSRQLPENTVPFILFSIATRKFSQQPALIHGILKNIDWEKGQKVEIEPFMYEISEKRQQGGLQVSGVTVLGKVGTAEVEFRSLSLFEITDDTLGDITKDIADWFNEKLR